MQLSKAVLDTLRAWTYEQVGPEVQKRLDSIKVPTNEFGVDPFGFDLEYTKAVIAPAVWLYKNYFRVKTYGIENVPKSGRVLLIANHSGQLPLDGAMIGLACVLECDPPRVVRSMVERWAPTLPYVFTLFQRAGQLLGTPENCRRVLAMGEAIQVFPEGVRGLNKPWKERYQLQEFGLGFMRLALETETPIVPVAVVGAEEQAMQIANLKPLAKLLHMPAFPITPTILPFPLPTRYHIHFGPPMRFSGNANDEDAEVEKKVKEVKAAIQSMLNEGVKMRQSIF